jgi:hypothetical protein
MLEAGLPAPVQDTIPPRDDHPRHPSPRPARYQPVDEVGLA